MELLSAAECHWDVVPTCRWSPSESTTKGISSIGSNWFATASNNAEPDGAGVPHAPPATWLAISGTCVCCPRG